MHGHRAVSYSVHLCWGFENPPLCLNPVVVKSNMALFLNTQSLCGHTSPVQSVIFDSEEVLVLAGSTSGVIKLWDLEETKSKSMLSALLSLH